jgi:serine/threonine-protein kinase
MGDLQTREEVTAAAASRLNLPLYPGQVLDGKYVITRLIGTGSMGFVFSASRTNLGDEVAIKVLRREILTDGQLVARFAQEARVAAKIKSEHVACVFDVGRLPDGAPFIVMERLEGKDLRWVLAERGLFSIELAVDYALQVCEALAIAHANGITHRDIKPENLFASRQGQGDDVIKVLDFGISKMHLRRGAQDDKLALVKTTMAIGSPMYMSPEQLRAAVDIDGRTDIWALGCVLYELVTGNPAFSAPSLTELCALILESKPPTPRSLGLDVPPDLEAVIGRCLEKDRAHRFSSVGELALALAPFAPTRSLVSVERCCDAQEVDFVIAAHERPDAATLKSFIPPRLPFNWRRAVVYGLGVAAAYVCCALLFAPHADGPVAVGTPTPDPPSTAAAAPAGTVLLSGAREGEESAGPTSPASTSSVQRTTQAATKPAFTRSKLPKASASRAKDELDVGF